MAKNPLAVEFANIPFKNPFMLSSAPPSLDARRVIRAAKLGWGGVVLKTVTEEPTVDPRTRLGVLRQEGKLVGMNNIELLSRHPLKTWTDLWIPEIKQKAPSDFVVIASIMSGPEPEGWTMLASTMSETGVDALELNVSCPHGSPEKHMGAFIGQDPVLVERVTRAAKKGTKLPVFVKLTPNVTDIVPIARAAVRGGANAISAINTVESLIGIDIETATPYPFAYDSNLTHPQSTYGGYCGPAIRPLGLRFVSQIAKAIPTIPISGIGGIDTWYNAVEYLMVGATTLQLCTAVMWYGFGIIRKLTKDLANFMKRKGYEKIENMIGQALPKITSWTALPKLPPVIAYIVPEKCILGKECMIACADAGYQAIIHSFPSIHFSGT
ncbi:MAG: NAD-dependent dihydropyrimidine dehydrogenase subunit PreA, partial [Candidatus Hermodarchaeota archaeon]|nr:NAD-dependent dihydropyrimidine dehydrogenase subunit PreA [Candidatus Hermodarchaeota archaeon]